MAMQKYKFEASCVFDGFRIDNHVVVAKNSIQARQKVRNAYKKNSRRCVTSINVHMGKRVYACPTCGKVRAENHELDQDCLVCSYKKLKV